MKYVGIVRMTETLKIATNAEFKCLVKDLNASGFLSPGTTRKMIDDMTSQGRGPNDTTII